MKKMEYVANGKVTYKLEENLYSEVGREVMIVKGRFVGLTARVNSIYKNGNDDNNFYVELLILYSERNTEGADMLAYMSKAEYKDCALRF